MYDFGFDHVPRRGFTGADTRGDAEIMASGIFCELLLLAKSYIFEFFIHFREGLRTKSRTQSPDWRFACTPGRRSSSCVLSTGFPPQSRSPAWSLKIEQSAHGAEHIFLSRSALLHEGVAHAVGLPAELDQAAVVHHAALVAMGSLRSVANREVPKGRCGCWLWLNRRFSHSALAVARRGKDGCGCGVRLQCGHVRGASLIERQRRGAVH